MQAGYYSANQLFCLNTYNHISSCPAISKHVSNHAVKSKSVRNRIEPNILLANLIS